MIFTFDLSQLRNGIADFSDALRRSFIAVLGVVVFALALSIPQAVEFLKGLALSCWLESLNNCKSSIGFQASPFQFIVFAVLAFLFSLTTWYCGRVLASYQEPRPPCPSKVRLFFERWIPRAAGLLVLVLTSYEILRASTESLLLGARLFALTGATFLVLLPCHLRVAHPDRVSQRMLLTALTVIVTGISVVAIRPSYKAEGYLAVGAVYALAAILGLLAWVVERPISKKRIIVIGIGVLVLAWILLTDIRYAAYSATKFRLWNFNIAIAILLPGLFLLFVVYREAFGWKNALDSLANRTRLGDSRLARILAPQLPALSAVIICSGLCLVVLAGWAIAEYPLAASALLVAPALMFTALVFLLLITTVLVFALPTGARFVLGLIVVGAIAWAGIPNARIEAARVDLDGDRCEFGERTCLPVDAIRRYYEEWSRFHETSLSSTKPIVLVAAAGGGSRAALHTGSLLARIDAATCGAFGDRIFAVSGVSGGSIGALAYSTLRRDRGLVPEAFVECINRSPLNRKMEHAEWLENYLARDHLSPVLASMLFSDIPRSVLPWDIADERTFIDRGGTLYLSLAFGYRELLRNIDQGVTRPLGIKRDANGTLGAGNMGKPGEHPILLFNASSVEDGRRVVQGTVNLCPQDGFCIGGQGGATLSGAIDSSRFSYVSPPSNQHVYSWDAKRKRWFVTQRSLIDGGYFDNSGIVTLLDVVDGLVASGVDKKRIYAIVISNNPTEGKQADAVKDYAAPGAWAQIFAPLVGVIAARDGRTEHTHLNLVHTLGQQQVLHWSLSDAVTDHLVPEAKKREEFAALQVQPSALVADRQRHPDQSPPLGWALAQDSARSIVARVMQRALDFEDPQRTQYESERRLREALFSMTARPTP